MLRLNQGGFAVRGGQVKIQIQPMLRLNFIAGTREHIPGLIQIQPMLRLN